MFDPDAPGKLPGPGVGELARHVRQRDGLRHGLVHGQARCDHAPHERPVIGIGFAIVALGPERLVGSVTGQVVVVAGVMISRSPPGIAD